MSVGNEGQNQSTHSGPQYILQSLTGLTKGVTVFLESEGSSNIGQIYGTSGFMADEN
jgi:hypothetical protein